MEILCLHFLGSCMGITNTLHPGELESSIFYPRPEERLTGPHSLLAGNSPSQTKNPADEVLLLPDPTPTLFQDFRPQCPVQRSSQPLNHWEGSPYPPRRKSHCQAVWKWRQEQDDHYPSCSAHQCNTIQLAAHITFLWGCLQGLSHRDGPGMLSWVCTVL